VLQKLGEHIANAFERAAAAEQRARETTDPEIRLDNESLARHWRMVARGFEFIASLEQFLLDSQRHRDLLPPEPPEQE
jgi:hypothetical protein